MGGRGNNVHAAWEDLDVLPVGLHVCDWTLVF